jgi:ribosomal-protein-alanine N-acetyltransferase
MISLETDRLLIRPFEKGDLEAISAIQDAGFGQQPTEERKEWLDWSISNVTALERLYQPPYGDRAVVLKTDGILIGSVGLVPSYGPFDKLPFFRERHSQSASSYFTPQIGLFWVIAEPHQRQGYAVEAARALIQFAFQELNLKHIVATTEYENLPSTRVMERLGMTIERNPDDTPPWFQIVGILENKPTLPAE